MYESFLRRKVNDLGMKINKYRLKTLSSLTLQWKRVIFIGYNNILKRLTASVIMDSPTNVFSRTHPSFRTSCERQSPISKKEQNIPGFRNSLGQEELFSQELNFNKLPRNTKKSFPIEEPKMRKKVRCSYHPEGCFKDSFESFIINLSP